MTGAEQHVHDFVLTERKKRALRLCEFITFTCTKCDEKWAKEWYVEPPIYSANDPRFQSVTA